MRRIVVVPPAARWRSSLDGAEGFFFVISVFQLDRRHRILLHFASDPGSASFLLPVFDRVFVGCFQLNGVSFQVVFEGRCDAVLFLVLLEHFLCTPAVGAADSAVQPSTATAAQLHHVAILRFPHFQLTANYAVNLVAAAVQLLVANLGVREETLSCCVFQINVNSREGDDLVEWEDDDLFNRFRSNPGHVRRVNLVSLLQSNLKLVGKYTKKAFKLSVVSCQYINSSANKASAGVSKALVGVEPVVVASSNRWLFLGSSGRRCRDISPGGTTGHRPIGSTDARRVFGWSTRCQRTSGRGSVASGGSCG